MELKHFFLFHFAMPNMVIVVGLMVWKGSWQWTASIRGTTCGGEFKKGVIIQKRF